MTTETKSETLLRAAIVARTREECRRLLNEGVAILKATTDPEGEWVDDPYNPGLVIFQRFDGYPDGYWEG